MAIWRSGARSAPRHTGREYDRGFQFRYPQRTTIEMGPWDSIQPFGEKDLPKTQLRGLQNGLLIDGAVVPIWTRSSVVTSTPKTVLAAKQVSSLGANDAEYGVIISINHDTVGTLRVEQTNGVVARDDSYGAFGGYAFGMVDFAQWGNYIYIVNDMVASVVRYDLTTGAFATVATMPGNGEKIFVLDNNMVILKHVAGVPTVLWSVDGLPEDFAGAGSGSTSVLNIGSFRGVGVMADRAFLIGTNGGKMMLPTGGLPAFAFRDIASVAGTPFHNAVEVAIDTIYYVGFDRRLYRLSNTGVELAQFGLGDIEFGHLCLCYVKRLNWIGIGASGEARFVFMDVATGKWVCETPFFTGVSAGAHPLLIDWPDAPVFDANTLNYEHASKLVMLEIRRSTITSHRTDFTIRPRSPNTPTGPTVMLPVIDFPEELLVEYIDIHRLADNLPDRPKVTVTTWTQADATQTLTFDLASYSNTRERGRWVHYPILRPAIGIKINITALDSAGSWLLNDGIDKVLVRVRKQRLEE